LIIIIIFLCYVVKIAFPQELKELPGGKAVIQDEKHNLGSSSFEEKAVFFVFILAALAWITRTFFLEKVVNENINVAIIAMTAAIILFIIPAKDKKGYHLFDCLSAVQIIWGLLLLLLGDLAF